MTDAPLLNCPNPRPAGPVSESLRPSHSGRSSARSQIEEPKPTLGQAPTQARPMAVSLWFQTHSGALAQTSCHCHLAASWRPTSESALTIQAAGASQQPAVSGGASVLVTDGFQEAQQIPSKRQVRDKIFTSRCVGSQTRRVSRQASTKV